MNNFRVGFRMAEHPIALKPNIDEPDIPVVVQPNIAVNAGFSIVIWKSDNGAFNRKKFFILGCERGGVYKERKRKSKKEDTATRKTLCPFRLRERLVTRQLYKTLFWAHPESIKLFNTFPTVLMMDSTYKTNKYKMPLFEIVGVTSTEESYNVGFAYIANEKEDNFVWALETCKSLLISKETFPNVIVTDRDKSLMNVVAKVFPNSTALVCWVYVYKNVKAKLQALCNAKEQKMDQLLKTLKLQWNSIVDSTSEESYTTAVVDFRKVFEKFPNFVKYVETTVLDPVKEKFVSAWTDNVMHIGNTTTNRVESQHGALKQYLTDCKGDLVKGWEAINQMVPNQLTKIKTSFGQTLKIEKKLPIRLDEVNTHWKRLQIDETVDGEVDCLQEFNVIQERLKSSDHSMKLQIRDQLRLIAYPEITSLTPPIKQVDTKGAKRGKSAKCNSSTTRSPSYWEYMDERFPDFQASQSKSSKPKRKTARIGNLSPNVLPCRSIKYMEYMSLFMHSYIEDIIDVKGDGHCGFRVAAEKEYEAIYGTKERFEYILNGLYPPKVLIKSGIAPSGCPLPPNCKEWKTHRAPEDDTWEDTFLDRMTEFDELMKNEKGDMEMETNKDDPINVD
ncbi:hypothetical protein TSUD_146730 [Trifolium subterraneum]|uniref:MULE transposase domain-containing protein n=1 Tax=Trifolium subterraneum TaxID=3900 RepID=A0A2Z6MW46_TRISU|nr:hypothetical protein TSUD_146730 [Trifolium subterraneum]